MAVSQWSEAVPSGQSLVGQFPTYARAMWNAVSQGMATEHYWSGTGGASDASSGDLLPGASRAYVGARSALSDPGGQSAGRAFVASDESRLYTINAPGFYTVGTPFFDECATPSGVGYWLRQTGQFVVSSSGTTSVTFAVPYTSTPAIFLTDFPAAGVQQAVNIGYSAGTTNFTSSFSFIGGASTISIVWESFGTASAA